MNRQGKLVDGVWTGGIEWTRVRLPDGRILLGYTWNPVKGCYHGCEWTMPDGEQAICYAKGVAESIAAGAYPHGFEHHYYAEGQLHAPIAVREPSGIFLDSMSDLWGHWVPKNEIGAVLDVTRRADWHIFLSLTKNAPRLLRFQEAIPENVWLGVSSPPDVMFGEALSPLKKEKHLAKSLQTLRSFPGHVTWMSFEPYSYDYSAIVKHYQEVYDQAAGEGPALDWAVIGAASNGTTIYDPNMRQVQALLDVLDASGTPVFYKGNMKRFTERHGLPWREAFPVPKGWAGAVA